MKSILQLWSIRNAVCKAIWEIWTSGCAGRNETRIPMTHGERERSLKEKPSFDRIKPWISLLPFGGRNNIFSSLEGPCEGVAAYSSYSTWKCFPADLFPSHIAASAVDEEEMVTLHNKGRETLVVVREQMRNE